MVQAARLQTKGGTKQSQLPPSTLSDEELERIDRERTRNVVRLAATDMLNSEIVTNRTRAYLSCESGEMIVKINFSAPFRGVAYANYDRSSHCKFYGDGGTYYEMIIPLKGCGTKQEAPRLFINNIIFRFHRSLELEEDEIKTIICRYPPPLAPPPVDPVPPILEPTAPVPIIVPAKLSEIELILIICGLLFLTLLLLGIGIAYYCLKRRNIKIVRKKKQLSTAPPSEITKLSQSTLFDQIRIPRATAHSTESSETIPSDYPSESLSDDDGRRTIVSESSTVRHDHFKYENAAFVPEPYPVDVEREDSVSNVPIPAIAKPNITTQNYLTTILETQNLTEEDVFDTTHRKTTSKLYKKLPPVLKRKPPSIPDDDDWSHSEIEEKAAVVSYVPRKEKRLETSIVDDTFIDKQKETEITEDTSKNKLVVYAQPKIMLKQIDDLYVTNISETTTTELLKKYSDAGQSETHRISPQPAIQSPSRFHAQPTHEILDVYKEDFEKFKSDTNVEYIAYGARRPPSQPRREIDRNEIIKNLMDNPPSVEGVKELTSEEKRKWRTVITTDEIFRSLIVESTTTEEFIRISRDIRYEKLFQPRTWETIIRMLTHPDVTSVETQTDEVDRDKPSAPYRKRKHPYPGTLLPKTQTRSSSIVSQASSAAVDYDLRSITEEDVTFSRPERDISNANRRTLIAERSMSEFSEHVPLPSSTSTSRQIQHVQRSTNISEYVVPSDRSLFESSGRHSPPLSGLERLDFRTPTESSSVAFQQRFADSSGYGYVRGQAIYQRATTQEYYDGARPLNRTQSVEGREEIKSVTETDIYDHWLRH
ncbi:hypothetical protein B4U79_15761 [Dinothrombium tinctorium]|uniref:ZP domain-containing protein n=1 Tax=Dinothrombium tinctorium TaxID=1965070 RepID=A0A3S3Q7M8_9ACAR|nr:hypothetical protein B4U79_06791 [Dinothrombium tinctorium]RWS15434.1 hypothetical protein B4U79_11955 [Dinothrombium tinctorium]RWS15440.1 hypothetical protein B4U79_11534 [Dinothrombium tinctorium]RWS17400.1 hypothetical protein B4U79_15761 [Dinothrombium tinctorium]